MTTNSATGAVISNSFGGPSGGFGGVGSVTNNFGTNLTPTGRTNQF